MTAQTRTERQSRSDRETPATAELAARLRVSTTRLARRLRQEADVHLTPSLHSALTVVHLRGPLTLGELAEVERVAPPTVTKLVAKLEERDLLVRVPDESDRRVCRVRTTATGEELLAASRERRTAWLAERLVGLDEAELASLERATDLIDHMLEEHDDVPPNRPDGQVG
jgi:DNA-binding MarR family transcriptional regulator